MIGSEGANGGALPRPGSWLDLAREKGDSWTIPLFEKLGLVLHMRLSFMVLIPCPICCYVASPLS